MKQNLVKLIGTTILGGVLYLTAHLTYNEVTTTNTGLVNRPSTIELANIKLVADSIFEKCRNHFNKPMYISSAYRSNAVNQVVGGVEYSQHTTGQAMDIDCDIYGGLTNLELYTYIHDSLHFDQLILENGLKGWVHCSFKKVGNRNKAFQLNN